MIDRAPAAFSDAPADLPKGRALALLALLYALSVALRIWLQQSIGAPLVFADEWQHVELARSLALSEPMHWGPAAANFPCWGYLLAIKPWVAGMAMPDALEAIGVMNALLLGLVPLLTYWMAATVATRQRALVAAGLAALLPALGYDALVMAEPLFLPVFMLAAAAGWRALDRPTAARRIAAGLAMGLAFHVKPHGLYLPVAFAAAAVAIELHRQWAVPAGERSPAAAARGILGHGLTAATWMVALAPRMLVVIFIERHPEPFSVAAFLGSYYSLGVRSGAAAESVRLPVTLACVAAWGLGAGLLPAAAAGRGMVAAIRREEAARPARMAIWVGALNAVMLLLVIRHTSGDVRAHERYFMAGYAPALALLAAADGAWAARLRPAARRWLAGAAIAAILMAAWALRWRLGSNLANDSPTLSILLAMLNAGQAGWGVIAGYLAALGAGVALMAAGMGRGFGWRAAAVALVLVAGNIGWYGTQEMVRKWTRPDRRIAERFAVRIPAGERLLVLRDGMSYKREGNLGFLLRGDSIYVAIEPEKPYPWYAWEAGRAADGKLALPPALPPARWLAVDARHWRLPADPVLQVDGCALYWINPAAPPRLIELTPAGAGR